MPVYHVSEFDVSAVQIDLSGDIFIADSANLSADYWVGTLVNFNEDGAIKSNADLNNMFKSVFSVGSDTYVGLLPVSRNPAGTRSNIAYDASVNTGFEFKDLGVIRADHTLYSSDIYPGVDALRESNNDPTSFNGKARAVLQALDDITGLREKMLASINASTGSDLGIEEDEVPPESDFGFLVVRNLNLAGTTQDRTIHIGIVLRQQPLQQPEEEEE
jgi:hypothetical protein